ncbi:MAG: DNA polymerase I [Clostridiales bacterium]|jgi:DNA polymerase-1|nr:DNA polymerase I [Clostridiales bacterium]
MGKLILIDGNSLINRAYYALPPLTNADGVPTQAVFGFATMLVKMIQDYAPDSIVAAFDLPGGTFRHTMYEGYKATRKGMPDELAVQMPLLKTMLRLMGITVAEKAGYEADDVIGTLAKRHGDRTYILTGDRDSLQLIDEKTGVILTKRGITETVTVTADTMSELFNMTPAQVLDYKALAGDSSDNIPGVAGIGEKTALDLLVKYGDLDSVYRNLDAITGKLKEKLENGRDSAYLSYKLARIDCEVPLEIGLGSCGFDFPFSLDVKSFFIKNNFKSLVKREELFADSAQTTQTAQNSDTASARTVELIEIKTSEDLARLCEGVPPACLALDWGRDIFLSREEARVYAIRIRHTLLEEGVELGAALSSLKPWLEAPSCKKLLFDAKTVKHALKGFSVDLAAYEDIKLMQFLCDLTVENETLPLLLEGRGLPKNASAAGLFTLYRRLNEELEALSMHGLYYEVELPLIEALYKMECEGVRIDLSLLHDLGVKFAGQADALTKEIYALCGHEFNINSPKQLAVVLFEELNIPYPKKTKKYSTGIEILSQIEDAHPVVRLILDYRFVTKLNSTYVEGLRRLSDETGIVHTEFKQMLTTTGRLSSAEPNLQNIPVREDEGRKLRGLFVARPGKTLVCADYSQIELRLLAHFSKDAKMLALYRENADIHRMTAAEVFGVSPEAVTDKMRRDAKTVNFGIIYGMSEYGLSQNLKCPVSVAKRYIDTYFEKFSAIKQYFDRIVTEAQKTGKTVSLLGRVRKIPELHSANYMTRQFGIRAAMNMPLQGSAADIIKIAMVQLSQRLAPMRSNLILQIHDELIVEAADDELAEVIEIVKDCMEHAVKLDVPLNVSVKSGKSWLDCE